MADQLTVCDQCGQARPVNGRCPHHEGPGACVTAPMQAQGRPAEAVRGLLRCSYCGDAVEPVKDALRWNGREWEHAHGQAGHHPCRWLGEGLGPLHPAAQVEIVGPSGKVHYRRPASHPDVAEALRIGRGYTVRLAEQPAPKPGKCARCGAPYPADEPHHCVGSMAPPAVCQPRVYLAARYSRRDEMRAVAAELRRRGCEVTSRWLDTEYAGGDGSGSAAAPPELRARHAVEDLDDVRRADVVVSFTEAERGGRGGRHVEYGAALAWGKRTIVVGPPEHLFHHYPGVTVMNQIDEWYEAVRLGAPELAPPGPVRLEPAPHTLGGQRQEDHLFRELCEAKAQLVAEADNATRLIRERNEAQARLVTEAGDIARLIRERDMAWDRVRAADADAESMRRHWAGAVDQAERERNEYRGTVERCRQALPLDCRALAVDDALARLARERDEARAQLEAATAAAVGQAAEHMLDGLAAGGRAEAAERSLAEALAVLRRLREAMDLGPDLMGWDQARNAADALLARREKGE